MALAGISLRGLRNLAPTTIEFDRGANYLFGPNGSGKTNLLEAIHYLAIGRSFRRSPDSELLGFGKDVLVVSGTDESGERAEIRFDGCEKRLFRNDVPVERLSEYLGWLPVIVLLLDDIELVRGAPGTRRNFLDMAIAKAEGGVEKGRAKSEAGSQNAECRIADREHYHRDTETPTQERPRAEGRRQSAEVGSEGGEDDSEGKSQEPRGKGEGRSYIALMGEYRRAVSQYNRLLERSAVSREPLADQSAAWEEELVRAGVPVYEARLARVGGLLESAAQHYERLVGHGAVFSYWSSVMPQARTGDPLERGQSGDSPWKSHTALRRDSPRFAPVFESSTDIAEAFRQRLAQTRERARVLGHALVGPHRDDIRVTREERELRKFGSVGEQRLAGIALRLAEADMILSAGRQRPAFLLDEVASELDEQRSRMVLGMVAERGQMVYAAARRMQGSRVQGFEGSGAEGVYRDRTADQSPRTPGPLNLFLGKEFRVEAGKVSEVS